MASGTAVGRKASGTIRYDFPAKRHRDCTRSLLRYHWSLLRKTSLGETRLAFPESPFAATKGQQWLALTRHRHILPHTSHEPSASILLIESANIFSPGLAPTRCSSIPRLPSYRVMVLRQRVTDHDLIRLATCGEPKDRVHQEYWLGGRNVVGHLWRPPGPWKW